MLLQLPGNGYCNIEEDESEIGSSESSTSKLSLSKNDVLKLMGQESSRVIFFSSISKSSKNAYKDWQCYNKIKVDEEIVPYVQCILSAKRF